ncbi:MAG TPA: hypothetical protein VEW94_07175, partial [Chloroflexia bacterium]|nr:hypothetical protein [Chloroflexia bacterium]
MAEGRSAEHHDHDERHKVQRTEAIADGSQTAFAPQQAPAYSTSLLGDPSLDARGNATVRNTLMRQLQRAYGNYAVQRSLPAHAQNPHQTFAVRAIQRWQASRLARV